MTENWDDLRAVLYVVRHGSLAAAGDALGVNYTTVARRISAAEAHYHTRFFDRFPQGYIPTTAGNAAARLAEKMEGSELDLRLQLGGLDETLSGVLTVTAPPLVIETHLLPVFDRFTALHPNVELRVVGGNELLNLSRREADIAIRVSNDPGDTLVGVRLVENYRAAFASATYAQQITDAPARVVDWIGYSHWTAPPRGILPTFPRSRIRMRFDETSAVIAALKAGLGVARLPLFVGRAAGLTRVPVLPVQRAADIWAVAQRDMWSSAKVSALKGLLVSHFRSLADDFTDEQAKK